MEILEDIHNRALVFIMDNGEEITVPKIHANSVLTSGRALGKMAREEELMKRMIRQHVRDSQSELGPILESGLEPGRACRFLWEKLGQYQHMKVEHAYNFKGQWHFIILWKGEDLF